MSFEESRASLRLCALLALTACGGGGGGGSEIIPPFNLYYSVVMADVNGDGLPDIVAAYTHIAGAPPHQGWVAVYAQDAARPGHFLPASTYGVGNDPVSVAVADLDGDGRPDIVTANAILSTNGLGESTVSVLLQDAAHPGHYLPAVSYATGPDPQSVAIGDLNGDGRPDLAVADSSGISVLFQDTAGRFFPKTAITTGGGCASVAIADLDGDGTPDLLATDAVSVLVLLQAPGSGGSFSAPARYAAGQQPLYAVAGDLNGDGRPDIAVANIGSPSDLTTASVSVLLQDPTRSGAFLAAVNYTAQADSTAVAIADLDGDGWPDLAVANSGTLGGVCPPNCNSVNTGVSVLLQDGAAPGHFAAAVDYAATGSDFVTGVAVADVNGDGKADLIVLQAGGVFIRLQDPLHPGQFLPARSIAD
ncbi:MAG TPA: VCBS repeat-containing protein [Steroidobacteraceae bacterium]|nr:VCBS repeat-containing protein [Steroidobacteraceae bacterium]